MLFECIAEPGQRVCQLLRYFGANYEDVDRRYEKIRISALVLPTGNTASIFSICLTFEK